MLHFLSMSTRPAIASAFLFLALGACAPDDAGVSDADADVDLEGFDALGDVGEEAEADSPEADAAEDDGAVGCPPLTTEELDRIYAAGAEDPLVLVTNDSPEGALFLHEPSVCVDPLDPAIGHLVSRMRRTLAQSAGGVGLAAPQVGFHRRIFLAQRTDQAGRPVEAFLNPWIVDMSVETAWMIEGCLSVPGASPRIERFLSVAIDHDLEDGTRVEAERIGGARGTQAAYAARIVQHEYDHLEGILIIDPR